MAIDQDGLFGPDVLAAVHHRVAGGFKDLGPVGAGFFQEFYKSMGAFVHVFLVLRLGADGRDAQEGIQFFEETVPVGLDIVFHGY